MAPYKNIDVGTDDDVSQKRMYNLQRDIFERYNDDPSSVFLRRYATKNGIPDYTIRQTSQTSDKDTPAQTSCESTSSIPNAPPVPPPPPPPAMNGNIPTIRLKSEISDRCEPPAKIQGAMMKDKKPFTYTPGGIDLSEIKSPRMQRRIVRNAQTPDDIILPPTSTVNTNSLPPSAVAAMTPQIAIPVFPQNGVRLSPTPQQKPKSNSPPPPPQKQQIPRVQAPQNTDTSQNSRTVVVNQTPQTEKPKEARAQVGSIYIPPVTEPVQSKPAFPTLREAPTPWLQKHQQQDESKPAWVNRNKNAEAEKEVIYERKPRTQQVQVEKEIVEPEKPVAGTRVIPIHLEGSQTVNQPNTRQNSQRWGADGGNQTVLNKNNINRANLNSSKPSEPDSKPIQSRSFKVIQKITGSGDDNTDFSSDAPYNTEGMPLSQLRRLQLCDDDQAFMNKVKSQENGYEGGAISIIEINNGGFDVDEDIFLHTETDPRYRGSAIPSKAFRMLQNMTESGQVIPTTIEVQTQARPKPTNPRVNYNAEPQLRTDTRTHSVAVENNEPQKKYIPPSERQAEQELRKYMGSSIPSRSFRMLQAMTATQDTATKCIQHADNIGEETETPFYPNPWLNPPKSIEEVNLFWIHYMYLFDLVLKYLPDKINPSIGDFWSGYERVSCNDGEKIDIIVTDDENVSTIVSDIQRDEYSKNQHHSDTGPVKDELIITEAIRNNSEPDVSLTVCIPLRRKSKPIEYHEEITIKTVEDTAPSDQTDAESKPQGSPENQCDTNDRRSPKSDLNVDDGSSDTEHSDSSSVDFWKEIADDDDISYKPRPITPFESTPNRTDSEKESVDNDEPRNQPNNAQWDLGDDIKNYSNYTEMDTESDSVSHIDQTSEDDSNESSDNDSYNMYEFSVQPTRTIAPVEHSQEQSEAEDSGMTSDLGKAEPEQAGSELRKLSKYQRANTHSRLLRILLEEEKSADKNDLTVRKESLTLPLGANSWTESISSSSGINSPMSPVVNEKLVNELVQSLLKCKGLSLRKLSPEKLRDAAIKSLQAETSDTSGTSSPYLNDKTKDLRHSHATDSSYTDYYDSWDENSVYYPGFDVFPSRAFKILQSGRTTPMNWPKCPLVSDQSPPSPSKIK